MSATIDHPATGNAALLMERIPGADALPAAQTRDEWLRARRLGVGGSDAAAAAGLSPWRSPFELYLDKLGELPPQQDTPPLYWGRKLEPIVMQAFAETLTNDLVFSGLPMLRSKRYPWMLANLDGMTASGGVVEAKAMRTRGPAWGEDGSGEVPMYIALQTQHNMIVSGLQFALVPVLFGGQELAVFRVEADPELQGMLIESSQEFMNCVHLRRPPTMRGIGDTILRYGGISTKGQIVARAEDLEQVRLLREARDAIADIGKTADAAKAWLMETLGANGDTLVDANGKVLATWKLPKAPQRFDTEAFAHKHPDLYAQFLRDGTATRRFLLKDE